MDLGSHLLDQALQLFGMPQAMSVDLMTQRDHAVANDAFHALLRYADGPRVILHASALAAAPGARFTLHGTRGSFVKMGLDPQEDALKVGQRPDGHTPWQLPAEIATLALQDAQSPDQAHAGSLPVQPGRYRAYYEAVRDAILGSGPNPVSPAEATRVMALLDLGVASNAARRELPVRA
jgi:predicted dehydrogenase